MIKKESRQFNLSVEGVNCETMYFKHLAALINDSESTYHLKVAPKVMSPLEYAKRNYYKPVERRGGREKLPYIHVQDVEDYHDDFQRAKFYRMLDEMEAAKDKFDIDYMLGYSNYTFELWMLLHVTSMQYSVKNRYAYLAPINRYFHRNFACLDDFKREDAFRKILDEYVTLESVKQAIDRAERIVQNNAFEGKTKESYRGFSFYQDNPDITVHEIVKLIFEVCGVK